MRVSITDRCNFRCRYCMPEGCEKVPMSRILTYEQIERICEAAVSIGITKFKITGGEPLVRLGCADLIRSIKAIPGVRQVTMTTNGMLLGKYLPELLDAGLDAVNISMDTQVPARFRYITGGGDLSTVKRSLDAAIESGIRTKVNCLIQKNFNEDEIRHFAEMAFEKGIDVRFIELMPVGYGDPSQGISNREVLHQLMQRWPYLEPDESGHGNGPAVYYSRPGKPGGIGFISALHGVFCGSCNRIRLTSQGLVKPCLCYEDTVDLRPYLDQDIGILAEQLRRAVLEKPMHHCFNDEASRSERRAMSQIGG